MQLNQWTIACTQLLRHWSRSGIHQVGASTPQSIALAASWLEQNSDSLTDEVSTDTCDDVYPSAGSASVVPVPQLDSVTLVKEPSPVQTVPMSSQSATVVTRGDGKWRTRPLSIDDRQIAFDELNEQVIACRKCEDIVCRRQRTVFGVGAVNARVVMFGEAPGAEEDRVGEPFVGAAGQLLDKILIASGLKRPDVYIVNALKCRPPNNRTPTDAEIENCRPFFEAQLETIQPEYIVCWGSVAVRAVLHSTESVGRLRGRFHVYRGAKVLVTYHPAYLLRTPDAKKLTWEDMKMLMKDMGVPLPGKS